MERLIVVEIFLSGVVYTYESEMSEENSYALGFCISAR